MKVQAAASFKAEVKSLYARPGPDRGAACLMLSFSEDLRRADDFPFRGMGNVQESLSPAAELHGDFPGIRERKVFKTGHGTILQNASRTDDPPVPTSTHNLPHRRSAH